MPASGEDIWKDLGVLFEGLHKSMVSIDKAVNEKKEKIISEIKQIPKTDYSRIIKLLKQELKKNTDYKNDIEIRKELGEQFNFYTQRYFEDIEKYVVKLIDLYQKKLPTVDEQEKLSEKTKPHTLKLADIFESSSGYDSIMKLLVDQGYCNKDTFMWKDQTKGNKGFLAALLKYLHTQQYYADNKRPTLEQIQAIAQNTFGWAMSIDTIKKANPTKMNVDFIPPASRIK